MENKFMYGKVIPGSVSVEFFDNGKKMELEDMQKAVEGYIELLWVNDGFNKMKIDFFIDEEGKLKNAEPTAVMLGDDDQVLDVVAGPILITATDGEGETIPLNEEQMSYIKENLADCAGVLFKGDRYPKLLLALKM